MTEQYKKWQQEFANATDQQLLDRLEEDKKKVFGWTSSRGTFLTLLKREIKSRGLNK